MPSYGGPGLSIQYTYVAISPFDAEHPIGSGIKVHYEPGDQFPGEEWGMAAHNLVEVGKAARLATNIKKGGGGGNAPAPNLAPESFTADEVNAAQEEDVVTSYPVNAGYGWFELSDGSKVRGREAAIAAEAALGGE